MQRAIRDQAADQIGTRSAERIAEGGDGKRRPERGRPARQHAGKDDFGTAGQQGGREKAARKQRGEAK